MIVGWLAACAAAFCYGIASVAESVGIRDLTSSPPHATGVRRAWAGRWYVAGLALDGVGFAASVVGLQSLPLFAVQSAVACSVGVTALTARVVLKAGLSRGQVVALAVLAAGLAALAVGAPAQRARAMPAAAAWALLAGVVPLAGLTAVAGTRRRRTSWPFPVLTVTAGLGFAGVGVAARITIVARPWWVTLATVPVWALAGYGLVAIVAYSLALARGPVTVAAAWSLAVETIVPALVGLLVLGDRFRPGRGVWALAGFVAVVGGCLVLAGRAHPDPPASPDSSPTSGATRADRGRGSAVGPG